MAYHLKFLSETETELRAEGYLFLFGDSQKSDLVDEYFTPETDSDSPHVKSGKLEIDFQHGRILTDDYPQGDDATFGYVDAKSIADDKVGRFAVHVLNLRNAYVKRVIAPLVKAKMLATSSEADPDFIQKSEDGRIAQWGLKKQSITPTPMEPRLFTDHQLAVIKSLPSAFSDEFLKDVESMTEETGKAEDGEKSSKKGKSKMSDTNFITRDEVQREFDDIKAQLSEITKGSAQITELLDRLENTPQAKGFETAPDSEGDEDANVKSFGDFLIAVRNGNKSRLQEVYYQGKTLSTQIGVDGGYLIPEGFDTQLLNVIATENPISSRVRRIDVARPSGKFPALDVYITPTVTGQTSLATGVAAEYVGEGDNYNEDNDPNFTMLSYDVKKIGGIVNVPKEVQDDAPMISGILTNLFRVATNSIVERHIIKGATSQEFTGISRSDALIQIDPDTNNEFNEADAMNMYAQFKSVSGSVNGGGNVGGAAWIMHRSVIPQFQNFTSSNTDLVEWRMNMPSSLLGLPIVYSEHVNALGADNAVFLADLGAYMMLMRNSFTVAFSEHAKFEQDVDVWKYFLRADGMPWVKDKIKLANGTYEVSPFVSLKSSS